MQLAPYTTALGMTVAVGRCIRTDVNRLDRNFCSMGRALENRYLYFNKWSFVLTARTAVYKQGMQFFVGFLLVVVVLDSLHLLSVLCVEQLCIFHSNSKHALCIDPRINESRFVKFVNCC